MANPAKKNDDTRRDLAAEWRAGCEGVRDGFFDVFFIQTDERCIAVTPENVDAVLADINAHEAAHLRP